MWIKICANTTLDDALLAAQLGADAVGFVFAPSTRHVTPAEVGRITPKLPASVEKVGIFSTLEAEEIAHIARIAHLDAVQLHGGVRLGLLRHLRALLPERIKIIQTVHWVIDSASSSATDVVHQLDQIRSQGIADRVLVDSKSGQASGGTGVAFDWSAARAVLAEAGAGLTLIVAGGLGPENVAQAVEVLRPWGVDVASGVESSARNKSHEKLAAFIRNARGYAPADSAV